MLDGKNYTVRVGWSLIYWTSHPNSNPYHIIYAISQVMSKLDLFSFYIHKNEKQRVSGNVYRFSFRSYVDLTQLLAFFLDLFVYLLRCLMISLYWDVSCVWAQYIYLESGKSTMPIEPCHVFARWGVTLISCSYLPVKPKTALFPPLPPSRGGKGRKGFHNSFRMQHVQRVHGSLFIYSLFCWSIWELLKKPLNGSFPEWRVFWNEQTFVR